MATDTLVLGGIVFDDFSTPQRLPFGGKQAMKVHKLIGGQRVLDTFGPDDDDITWSGIFYADDAAQTIATIDSLRVAGAQLPLVFGGQSFMVVIGDFVPAWRRFPVWAEYSITCVIAVNNQSGILGAANPGVDTLISNDLSSAQGIVTDNLTNTAGNIG
jgi:hypothetical protein